MTGFILLILIISALGHACWNAISKHVEEKEAFFTIIIGLAIVLYLPLAIYIGFHHSIPTRTYPYMAGSTICELVYFWSLARAYRQLPFSYAFPIVRGLGPLVSTILSFFLGVSLTWIGFGGIFFVVGGILLLQFSGRFSLQKGTFWAFLAGAFNGGAITFDSLGAGMMSGVLFKYLVFIGIVLGKLTMDRITIYEYKRVFLSHYRKAVIGALFIFGTNAVAQYALESTPVGYVSATRELSIVFGTLIGWIFFKEELRRNHYLGIGILIAGIFMIKFGG